MDKRKNVTIIVRARDRDIVARKLGQIVQDFTKYARLKPGQEGYAGESVREAWLKNAAIFENLYQQVLKS